MAALVLSLSVFAFLTLVGYAILALLAPDEQILFRLLLAPVLGTTGVMLVAFVLNQLGLPVSRFALPLCALLFAGSLAVLWRRAPRIGARDLWPFVGLSLVALLATGWPMLRFGLDWVSFCNDDMANYCMGAERLLHHGYYQPPDAAGLAGIDYNQFSWMLHVLHRPGSELCLAITSALTGISSLRIFMPVILAFTLCQITAAGAMTFAAAKAAHWDPGRTRLATWGAVALMSLSALVAFGTLYQLIAQVIGLGMMAGLLSVLMRPLDLVPRGRRLQHGILIGILFGGVVLAYTEIVPFVVLGYGLYALLTVRQNLAPGRPGWRPTLAVLSIGAGAAAVLLNRYVPVAMVYLFWQVRSATPEDPATTMFPHYMMPSGPVYFWGLFAMGQTFPSDREISILIVTAIGICVAAFALVWRSLARRQAPAVMCVVMFLVWVFLFHRRSGFGMYKLAMYFQPFILSAVVLGWVSLWRHRILQVSGLALLGLANVRSHRNYTLMSLGSERGGFSEISAASSTHVVREYAGLLRSNPGRPLELDTANIVLAKFQMIESAGRPAIFPSNNFLSNLTASRAYGSLIGRARTAVGVAAGQAFTDSFPSRQFAMHPPAGSTEPAGDAFPLVLAGQGAVAAADAPPHPLLFVGVTGRQAPFNRWHDPERAGGNFRAGGIDAFRDHLIFTASALGEPYYVTGRHHVAIYQLEPDVLFGNTTMAAVGRYLLFRVVNPSPQARLELELTDTLTGDGENRLPPAAAIGADRVPFPIPGRGAARVFSPPIRPQFIDGLPFVALDMGTYGNFIKYAPGGLMQLWGRNVRLDHRQIVGFLRDVSLVPDDAYQKMRAPAAVERFPQDLAQPTLEYAGFYEDGYVGDAAFVALGQPTGAARLVVRGMVPKVNDPSFTCEVVLKVDGAQVERQTIGLDEFELNVELPPAPASGVTPGRRRVELSFSRLQSLPAPDGRPVSAKLAWIGFAESATRTELTVRDLVRRKMTYSGIFEDGWTGAKASVRLVPPAGAGRVIVRAMVPRIADPSFATDVSLEIDGAQVAQRSVSPGDFEIAADLPAGSGPRTVSLSFSRLQRLPLPDTRDVGARLQTLEFEPAAASPASK